MLVFDRDSLSKNLRSHCSQEISTVGLRSDNSRFNFDAFSSKYKLET